VATCIDGVRNERELVEIELIGVNKSSSSADRRARCLPQCAGRLVTSPARAAAQRLDRGSDCHANSIGAMWRYAGGPLIADKLSLAVGVGYSAATATRRTT
jgi:hypothetical protein